jgi:hypothetical protein
MYGVEFAIFNHAIIGAKVANPAVNRPYRSWLEQTPGGIVVLAWGLLNDLNAGTPPTKIVGTIRHQIGLALATGHPVYVVSPPPTTASFIRYRSVEPRLWHRIEIAAQALHSSNVHVINVLGPETQYLERHHLPIARFMATYWDPNTRGYQLAARFLEQALEKDKGLGYSMPVSFVKLLSGKTASSLGSGQTGTWQVVREGRAIAAYINAHPRSKVLLDTFNYWNVIPFIRHPGQVIMTGDQDFESVLHNPKRRVALIVTPDPVGGDQLDAVDTLYPTMYSGGLPWTQLVAQFPGGTRLYRVLSNAP